MISPYIWAIITIATVLGHRLFLYSSKPLPPGPKPKFFTGNLHQLPKNSKWKTYKEWSLIYGPIFLFSVFRRRVIILNTFKAANDLLERRSKIYSDRPYSWIASEISGKGLSIFTISSEHSRHKVYRRLLQSSLSTRAVRDYYDLMDQESCVLTENLLKSPGDFIGHFRQNAGAIILQLAYGWRVTGANDRFVVSMEKAFTLDANLTKPGQWLVDIFPLLRFIPSWFPGGSFKTKAKEYGENIFRVYQVPYDWAKGAIKSGNYIPSFTSQHFLPEDGHNINPEEEDIIKWCCNALYVGGTDTMVSFMTAFIAAMTLYPSVQQTAQQEVDQVLGLRRPRLGDQASMPYISALIKEVLRWASPVPLGLPHRVTEDDTYSGYFVPKGTTIFANVWGISHDEYLYPNPEEFSPERYLGSSPQLDPRKFAFGFGRRVCPGAAFAEASIFMNITSILSSFTISKALDANGEEVSPKLEFTGAIVSHIKPFMCSIERRADSVG